MTSQPKQPSALVNLQAVLKASCKTTKRLDRVAASLSSQSASRVHRGRQSAPLHSVRKRPTAEDDFQIHSGFSAASCFTFFSANGLYVYFISRQSRVYRIGRVRGGHFNFLGKSFSLKLPHRAGVGAVFDDSSPPLVYLLRLFLVKSFGPPCGGVWAHFFINHGTQTSSAFPDLRKPRKRQAIVCYGVNARAA